MRGLLLVCASILLAPSAAAAAPQHQQVGEQIAVATTSGRIVLIDGSGHKLATLSKRSGRLVSDWAPAWSPDGEWLAFARSTDGFTTDINGRNRRPVLHGRDAHWSADGRAIVFTPPNGGVATLTGGKRRFLGRGYKANWSPDATQIIYARLGRTAAGDTIWSMNSNGRGAHRIMNGVSDPAWRPSGT